MDDLERDRLVRRLAALARRYPNRARAAGGRVMERVRAWTESQHDKKRQSATVRRDLIARALDMVRQRPLRYRRVKCDPEEYFHLLNYYKYFRIYDRTVGIGDEDAVNAYLKAFEWIYPKRAETGSVPVAEAVEAQRERLNPQSESVVARAAFGMADQLMSLMREDRVMHSNDWWEVAVLTLMVEDPDVHPESIGLDPSPAWGSWREAGEDLFNHRDGMRTYMLRTAGPDADHWDASFWATVVRAVEKLEFLASKEPHDDLFVTRERVAEVLRVKGEAFRKRLNKAQSRFPPIVKHQPERAKRPRAGWWISELTALLDSSQIAQLRENPGYDL